MAGALGEWFEWFMDMSLHSAYFPSRTSMAMRKDFGRDYGVTVITIRQGRGKWSSPLEKLEEQGRFVLEKFAARPAFEEKIWKWFNESAGKLDEKGREIESTELRKLSDAGLKDLYQKACDAFYEMWEASIFVDGISIYGEKALVKAVNEALRMTGSKRRAADCISVLTAPTRKSFMAEMEEELAGIAGAKKEGGKWEDELQAFAGRWHWIQNNYLKTERLSKEFFLKLLEEAKGQKQSNASETIKRRQEMFEELQLHDDVRALVEQVDKYSFFQDERKKYTLKGFGFLDLLLAEIARRNRLPLEDLKQMLPAEVFALLETSKYDGGKLLKRQSFVIAVFGEKDVRVAEGEEGEEQARAILGEEETSEELTELHGVAASPGKAVGRVKVLNSAAEVGKVEAGDVIVAGMTEPDYVLAMKKAVAIVTNEGGITSHAAVVSRELGIPCVIGTKIATKIFRDGDLVEVNANHGIVRKVPQ